MVEGRVNFLISANHPDNIQRLRRSCRQISLAKVYMKKFVILSSQRTGSIFLRVWLNYHPQIRSHGEIFGRRHPGDDSFLHYCKKRLDWRIFSRLSYWRPFYKTGFSLIPRGALDSYLAEFFSENGPSPWVMEGVEKIRGLSDMQKSVVGFKIMYPQLKAVPELLRRFIDDEYFIIHLVRRNHLQQFVSVSKLHSTRTSYSIKRDAKYASIYVSPKKLMTFIRNTQAVIELYRSKIGSYSNRYMEVFYESFFTNMEGYRKKILGFLGVPQFPLGKPGLKKMRSNDITREITNYKEIIQLVENSPYESFLREYQLP